MPKLRSISARLVLAIALTVAVACLLLTLFFDREQRAAEALALDQQLQQQYETVLAALEFEARTARAVATGMAALPPIMDATARQDRDSILALLEPAFGALKQQGIPIANITLPPATLLVRLWDPKAYGDDVSARRKTLVVANQTAKVVSGIEPGRDILSIYGVVPMVRDGKSIGVVDVGISFDQAFVERLKRRFGLDLAVHVRDGDHFKAISSTSAEQTTATTDELDAAMRGATVRRNVTVGGHPAAVYLGEIKDFAGEPVAVLELVKDTTANAAAAAATRRDLVLGSGVIVLLALGVALVLGRGLSRPVAAMTHAMKQLATGDTAVTVPGRDRRDELGTMADAVEVFRVSMIETERLRTEQQASERRAEAERRAGLLKLADELEAQVRSMVASVAEAATGMQQSATRLNATAQRTSEQSTAVSAAAEQASANVQTMAAATEELAHSITEVSQLVEKSTAIIGRAAADATRTDQCIQGLDDAAQRIGGVVKLITEIASQTNLLALNATIEAARAGDAGRGFAVVASEVKALAGQTAGATDEISNQVAAIQAATREAVEAIRGISGTIAEVNQIAVGIASAIQQQGAATREISRNGQHAAVGTCDVTANINGVSQATGDTRAAAGEVLSASGRMIEQSTALSAAVDRFLAKVRAA